MVKRRANFLDRCFRLRLLHEDFQSLRTLLVCFIEYQIMRSARTHVSVEPSVTASDRYVIKVGANSFQLFEVPDFLVRGHAGHDSQVDLDTPTRMLRVPVTTAGRSCGNQILLAQMDTHPLGALCE